MTLLIKSRNLTAYHSIFVLFNLFPPSYPSYFVLPLIVIKKKHNKVRGPFPSTSIRVSPGSGVINSPREPFSCSTTISWSNPKRKRKSGENLEQNSNL